MFRNKRKKVCAEEKDEDMDTNTSSGKDKASKEEWKCQESL